MSDVAALFVYADGIYSTLEGIDPWGIERDAMTYDGDLPVVAHPPCTRWCRLAGLIEARWGHKKGDDGGMFKHALDTVRRCGGVLEHPAYSDAWKAYGLRRPPSGGGWVRADWPDHDGWTCHVEQAQYGHPARKATWLYAVGVELPALRWGQVPSESLTAAVSHCGNREWEGNTRRRIQKHEAAATPLAFAEQLVAIARARRRST